MIVTVKQVQNGVSRFMNEIVGKNATGVRKFGVYFVLPSVSAYIEAFWMQMKDNQLFSDLFTQDGNLDIDKAYQRAKDAMSHCQNVEILGLRLDSSDIDTLNAMIREG